MPRPIIISISSHALQAATAAWVLNDLLETALNYPGIKIQLVNQHNKLGKEAINYKKNKRREKINMIACDNEKLK